MEAVKMMTGKKGFAWLLQLQLPGHVPTHAIRGALFAQSAKINREVPVDDKACFVRYWGLSVLAGCRPAAEAAATTAAAASALPSKSDTRRPAPGAPELRPTSLTTSGVNGHMAGFECIMKIEEKHTTC